MFKTFLSAAVFVAGSATLALAQGTPANQQDCLKSSFALAKSADAKKLPDAQLDKIEEMLTKMEALCDGKNFADAAKLGEEIKAAIEGKK